MSSPTDAELYPRGRDTLLASWEAYARGATGAALHRLPGVAAAVFPHEPERAVYNNALLDRDLGASERAGALDAMEAVYAAAGVARFVRTGLDRPTLWVVGLASPLLFDSYLLIAHTLGSALVTLGLLAALRSIERNGASVRIADVIEEARKRVTERNVHVA